MAKIFSDENDERDQTQATIMEAAPAAAIVETRYLRNRNDNLAHLFPSDDFLVGIDGHRATRASDSEKESIIITIAELGPSFLFYISKPVAFIICSSVKLGSEGLGEFGFGWGKNLDVDKEL